MKRIKSVQVVQRPVVGYGLVHPQKHPELFGPGKVEARRKLKDSLEKVPPERGGWRNITFKDTPGGMLRVEGQCLRDLAVLDGALNGHYDLFLQPPDLGDKPT